MEDNYTQIVTKGGYIWRWKEVCIFLWTGIWAVSTDKY